MGGSASTESLEIKSPFAQDDGLLKLLIEADKQKEDEYKESQEKLNKKLEYSRLAKTSNPHAAAFFNLKYNKFQLKLKKCTEQYKSETNYIAAIRKIYSDQKEQLRAVENEKTIQVANLNLDIVGLNVNIDNLKQQIKDRDVLYETKEQQNFLVSCEQKHTIAELKKKEEAWDLVRSADLDTYKQQIRTLKLEKQTLCKEHEEKYEALSEKYRSNQSAGTTLRTSNSYFSVAQSRLQQEIMCLKTTNQQLIKRMQNDDTKYNDLLVKYKREEQSNEDLRTEISALNVILTSTVKLTTLQQRGIFLDIKKSLRGLKVDLQFLIPNLNERTLPTLLDGNKEMEKLNTLLARSQENLHKIIEYQERFNSFVSSKQPMAGMEVIPNFLSGAEMPCSFLHLKFLPLFRITFSTPIQNNPKPLLAPFNYYPSTKSLINQTNANENKTPTAYQPKSRHFVPTFQNQRGGDNDSSESTRQNTNANYRGRGGRGANSKRRPRLNQKPIFKTNNTVDGHVSADANDSDCESSSGVTLTVLTDATTSGAAQKIVEVKKFEEKTDCVICGEWLKSPLTPVHVLEPCMHKYHRSCIDEWFESNTECPECAMED